LLLQLLLLFFQERELLFPFSNKIPSYLPVMYVIDICRLQLYRKTIEGG
jgi:hypothetical protein